MSLEDIQLIASHEAIRARPGMYIPLDALAPNHLLIECLCAARDAAKGVLIHVDIHISRDRKIVTIADDGPGWDVTMTRSGIRVAEAMLTVLYACRSVKADDAKGACHYGLAVLTALCQTFAFRTCHEGKMWAMNFFFGRPQGSLQEHELNNLTQGTIMTFTLDAKILPIVEVDVDSLKECLATLSQDGFFIEMTVS